MFDFATAWTLQHARLPCPSLSPRVYSHSRPLSRWCHPTISSSVTVSSSCLLCHRLLFLPSKFPSIRVFSKESALHIRWSKSWSFSFSINPSNEYSGLISFRTDWFDLLINEWMSKKWMSEGCKIFLLIPQMSFSSFICTITKFYFIYLSSLSQEFLVDEAHVTFFFVPQIC